VEKKNKMGNEDVQDVLVLQTLKEDVIKALVAARRAVAADESYNYSIRRLIKPSPRCSAPLLRTSSAQKNEKNSRRR
jgi:hypothetical protein